MAVKRKVIGASGRYGVGYGKIRVRLNEIERIQRKKQICPFCSGRAKRVQKGIWRCNKCNKKFAGGVFSLT